MFPSIGPNDTSPARAIVWKPEAPLPLAIEISVQVGEQELRLASLMLSVVSTMTR